MKYQGKDKARIILGIDPGSIVCGYGVINVVDSIPHTLHSRVKGPLITNSIYIASGRIVLSSKKPLHVRLKELHDNIVDIIREYSPDEIAIEKVFFAKGVKAALTLGHARGAALIAAASCGLPVYEYSALEVKKAIVGYGRAEKHQVQVMVAKMLDLKFKLSNDSADALAIALCHVNTVRTYK